MRPSPNWVGSCCRVKFVISPPTWSRTAAGPRFHPLSSCLGPELAVQSVITSEAGSDPVPTRSDRQTSLESEAGGGGAPRIKM